MSMNRGCYLTHQKKVSNSNWFFFLENDCNAFQKSKHNFNQNDLIKDTKVVEIKMRK